MKKNKFGVILTLILICCVLTFSACTPLSLNNFSLKKFEANLQNEEYISIETEGLTSQQTRTELAEQYINISFTVLIGKTTTTITTDNLTGATTTEEGQPTFVSFGSGVVVKTGGYIATNFHVISSTLAEPKTTQTTSLGKTTKTIESYAAYCSQDGGDNSYPATVLWYNANYDMAIIVCPHYADLSAAPMKDRSVYCSDEDRIKVLEEVITIGTQKECENYNSATIGTISSSVNRSVYGSDLGINYEYLIQHNAAINHGNSGGALIDMDGYLIGLNTLGDDSANSLFYAISIYPIIQVIDIVASNWELDEETTTDYLLGFSGYDALEVKNFPSSKKSSADFPDYAADFVDAGVLVTSINENPIIENLQVKDVITKFVFGTETTKEFTINNRYDLLNARLELYNYQTATVTVLRDGEEVNLTLNRG
ncbi:MAG: trypsin-like peptidase domain-containing protein [Clostridia bacterium]|nr:trypsin-like peptidase domain-containing protein [Clostridia bacterium]